MVADEARWGSSRRGGVGRWVIGRSWQDKEKKRKWMKAGVGKGG